MNIYYVKQLIFTCFCVLLTHHITAQSHNQSPFRTMQNTSTGWTSLFRSSNVITHSWIKLPDNGGIAWRMHRFLTSVCAFFQHWDVCLLKSINNTYPLLYPTAECRLYLGRKILNIIVEQHKDLMEIFFQT